MQDEDSAATHAELMRQAADAGPGLPARDAAPVPGIDAFALARAHFGGPLILNDGFDGNSAEAAIAGRGGRGGVLRAAATSPIRTWCNRLRTHVPLAAFDRRTLYTDGATGYTDYPLAPATLA
jgi:N-ethylmaleimide reductase